MAGTKRIIVVDDSTLMQKMISGMLDEQPDLTVVGVAGDPFEAREMIRKLNPDVITLDVEMPRMDGLTFLEKIMTLRPMPVVMVSSLTREGATATVKALEIGAADVVAKPKSSDPEGFAHMATELVAKVRAAAAANIQQVRMTKAAPTSAELKWAAADDALVAIGASTGGVERVRAVLQSLPADGPPVLICQHMAPGFLASFAERLDTQVGYSVAVAQDGEIVGPGQARIGGPDGHLEVSRKLPNSYRISVVDEPPVGGHRPAVDRLFRSCAKIVRGRGVGVMLSGMGSDGAEALTAWHQAGAPTIGESESSCVVYGMPRAAKALGGIGRELAASRIPGGIVAAINGLNSK